MANIVTIEVQTNGAKALDSLKKSLTSLAPAAIPVAAGLTAIAAQGGAAAIATAAFGAAVAPQTKALSEAAKSETGMVSALGDIPPATKAAATSFVQLKHSYQAWSDALAADTMPVVNKGIITMSALLPNLTGLVKGASAQFDRLMNVIGGGVANGAFAALSKQFTGFATGALKNVTDGLIHLARVTSEGDANGPIKQFIEYAKENAPKVKDTLKNLADALLNILSAASAAGPSMLTIVNALAKMVAAIPPSFLGVLLKLYTTFKLVSLAGSAFAALSGLFGGMSAALTALAATSAAAGGGLTGLGAAFMSLSVAARAAIITTGVGAIVVALVALSNIGKDAPPDVDKMTTSLRRLADTGKVTGEAARTMGKDLGGLGESLSTLSRPSNMEKTQQFLTRLIGMDSTPVKNAKEDFDALDKGLASLVKGGSADQAALALEHIKKGLIEQKFTAEEVDAQLGEYKSSLADLAFEQELAAEAMGLFGTEAQETQGKLDAQKQSADGLRQSIQALNEVNQAALGGMIGFEASIDAAAKAAQENAGSLEMVNGQLDLNSPKAQAAATALNDLAAKTDAATAAARDNGASWETVNGIYVRGREQLIKNAIEMGLNRSQAEKLANQILKTPDKTAYLKGNIEDLQEKLSAAKKKLKETPPSKTTAVKGNIADLEAKIAAARRKLDALNGKTAYTYVYTSTAQGGHPTQRRATGGIIGAAATGGPRNNNVLVGEQGPEIVNLAPGSMVRSNPDTKRLLGGAGSGGTGQPIVINMMLDGRVLAQQLIDPLRGEVRRKGGVVQSVLGK